MNRFLLIASLLAISIASFSHACTVITEDDSVPGDLKGWAGLYYTYTGYTGSIADGEHVDFPGNDDYVISHGLTLEGTLGFARDFYAKLDVPYGISSYKTSVEGITSEDSENALGDTTLTFKWNFLNPEEGTRSGVLLGANLPTSKEKMDADDTSISPKIGYVIGTDLGPGRIYANAGYTLNPTFESLDVGDNVNYSLAYNWNINPELAIPLELVGSYILQDKTEDTTIDESGSHVLAASVAATYSFANGMFTLCGGALVPVLKQGYTDDYSVVPHLTLFYNF